MIIERNHLGFSNAGDPGGTYINAGSVIGSTGPGGREVTSAVYVNGQLAFHRDDLSEFWVLDPTNSGEPAIITGPAGATGATSIIPGATGSTGATGTGATGATGVMTEMIYRVGPIGPITTFTPNYSLGSIQTITANVNFTLALPINMPNGGSMALITTQSSTGNKVMTANAGYKFAGSGFKTLSTSANAIDMLNIFRADNTYYVALTLSYR